VVFSPSLVKGTAFLRSRQPYAKPRTTSSQIFSQTKGRESKEFAGAGVFCFSYPDVSWDPRAKTPSSTPTCHVLFFFQTSGGLIGPPLWPEKAITPANLFAPPGRQPPKLFLRARVCFRLAARPPRIFYPGNEENPGGRLRFANRFQFYSFMAKAPNRARSHRCSVAKVFDLTAPRQFPRFRPEPHRQVFPFAARFARFLSPEFFGCRK